MNVYRSLLIVLLLVLSGCDRSGDDTAESLSQSSILPSGGKVVFDVISKSNTLIDFTGNFNDRGHYSMVFQAKSEDGNFPISGLDNSDFYSMYENGIHINESKLAVSQESKTVSNQILLLLDFSGSIVDDCSEVNASTSTTNLCYQIVNSSKQFIDQIVSENQTMAIYYFNSKSQIQALWTSSISGTTDDKEGLKSSLDNLYSDSWREENLEGFNHTNLYGAVSDSTAVVCRWLDDCDRTGDINIETKENQNFATVVVFTDGRDTVGRVTESEMLAQLALYQENYYYYTIGLGDVDDDVLESIGTSGYLKATQTDKLDVEFNKLGEQLSAFGNSFYKIDYCPAQQAGIIDLNIKVNDQERKFFGEFEEKITLLNIDEYRCDL